MTAEPKGPADREPVRLAVMGAGRWGANVVRTLARLDGVDLAWVADPDPVARERAAAISPDSRICDSIERVLSHVRGVVICTPATDHFEHASVVLTAGKHALVEKPMATSSDEAARLVDRAEKAGLTLMVGHQLLFHPLFVELEQRVRAGGIGRLTGIDAERTGTVDTGSDPDVLWAYGPHDVSMILTLVGEVPGALSGAASLDPKRGTLGQVSVDLEFASSLRARVDLDGTTPVRRRRLTVVGERGTAVFDDTEPGGRLTVTGDESITIGPDVDRGFEPLARSLSHFVDCVRRRRLPRTDGRHGQVVTRVIEGVAANVAVDGSAARRISNRIGGSSRPC